MVISMKKFKLLTIFLVFLLAIITPATVHAQDYSFEVSDYEVEAYLEADGSLTLYYFMVFQMIQTALRLTLSIWDYQTQLMIIRIFQAQSMINLYLR